MELARVSQGRICSDNFTCCHTEIEVADQTLYLTQSQYTDTGPTSPSTDPITPGAWQGSHWCANFEVTGMTRPRKNPGLSRIRTRDLPLSRQTPQPLGHRGRVFFPDEVELPSTNQVLWSANFCYLASLWKRQRRRVFPWCRLKRIYFSSISSECRTHEPRT